MVFKFEKKGASKLEKSVEEKNFLLEEARRILEKKNWGVLAKKYIMETLDFIYDNYKPQVYVKTTVKDYIKRYLTALDNLMVFRVLGIEELNEDTEEAGYFRNNIAVESQKNGNLDILNGMIVPAINGRYECVLSGYADRRKKAVFLLEETDSVFRSLNVLHELTHTEDGLECFRIPFRIPYGREFHKMCVEGRAVFEENMMQQEFLDATWGVEINDDKTHLRIVSNKNPYPLYDILYRLLYFIVGPEVLDYLHANENINMNVLEVLQNRFPHIDIAKMYAHFAYILAKGLNDSKNVIKNNINIYKREEYKLFSKKQAEYDSYVRALRELHQIMMMASSKQEFLEAKRTWDFATIDGRDLILEMENLQQSSFSGTLKEVLCSDADLKSSFLYLIDLAYKQIDYNYKVGSNEEFSQYMAKVEATRDIEDYINNSVVLDSTR